MIDGETDILNLSSEAQKKQFYLQQNLSYDLVKMRRTKATLWSKMKTKRNLSFGSTRNSSNANPKLGPGTYNPKAFQAHYKTFKQSPAFLSKDKKGLFVGMMMGDLPTKDQDNLQYLVDLEPGPGSYHNEKFTSSFRKAAVSTKASISSRSNMNIKGSRKNSGLQKKGKTVVGTFSREKKVLGSEIPSGNPLIGPGKYHPDRLDSSTLIKQSFNHAKVPFFTKSPRQFSDIKDPKKEKPKPENLGAKLDLLISERRAEEAKIRREQNLIRKRVGARMLIDKEKDVNRFYKEELKRERSKSPGPGTYDLRAQKSLSTKGGVFGSSNRLGQIPELKQKQWNPAPGYYDVPHKSLSYDLAKRKEKVSFHQSAFGCNQPRFSYQKGASLSERRRRRLGDAKNSHVDGDTEEQKLREVVKQLFKKGPKTKTYGKEGFGLRVRRGRSVGVQFGREVIPQFFCKIGSFDGFLLIFS